MYTSAFYMFVLGCFPLLVLLPLFARVVCCHLFCVVVSIRCGVQTMCVYVYVCMYYVYMCKFMFVCVSLCMCMCMCTYVCLLCVCTSVFMCMCDEYKRACG